MSFKNLFKFLTLTSSRRRPTRRPSSARLSLEALEDRCLPSFSQPVDIGADHPLTPGSGGYYPQSVIAADFNGDGRLDLATALRLENTVSVVLGNGNGTFQAPRTSTCIDPRWIQAGDLNSDGKADLVTWNNSDSIHVRLGNGDGTFQPPQAITVEPQISPGNIELGLLPQYLQQVAIGDFNGDGKLDLVAGGVTEWTTVLGYNEDGSPYYDYHDDFYANVLLGNGDGTFLLTGVKSTPNPMSPDTGDFNNDGRLDLLTGWFGPSSGGVLPGNGDGTFGELVPSTATIVGFGGVSHPVGDFNGDGNLDVLWVDSSPYFYNLTTSVVFGNGDGTFRPGYFEPVGDNTVIATAAGDVNADGKLDIVAIRDELDYADFTTTRSMRVLLGGSFAPIDFDLGTFPGLGVPTSAVLADFDGDGLPDLATTDFYAANDADPSVYRGPFVARNDGIWTVPPPPPPSMTIGDVTVTEGNTGTRAASFTVTLSAAYGQPVTVAYTTSNGTATAGSDYQASSGILTIPAGQTTGTITVLVNGDRLAEPNETFVVNLSAPTNATIADSQGIGTILDDEPRMSINDVTVTEGNTGTVNATFTVSLSVAYDVAVTVHYQTANGSATAGSDYAAASGDEIIAAGQTTKTFTALVIGDRSAEPTENFVVNLSAATNGSIVDSQGVGTILDNEPRISISDVAKAEGKKNQTTQFTFTVTLSAAYDQAVTMSYRTVDGTATTGDGDYIARTGTLTFAPGETTKTITIEVNGDSKKEANETFYLDLFGNSGNSLFTKNRGIGTILNDD